MYHITHKSASPLSCQICADLALALRDQALAISVMGQQIAGGIVLADDVTQATGVDHEVGGHRGI